VQRSWVEIDEGRLKENYRVVCEAAGAEVLAVVKANAYGHGLEQCAVALARAGVRWLGVADAAEGGRATRALEAESLAAGSATSPLATREASLGMTELLEGPQILVMCGVTRDEVSAIGEHGLTPVVWTMEQAQSLAQAEGQRQIQGSFAPLRMTGHGGRRRVPLHVEIDTGMGRQGVRPGAELEALLRAIAMAGLELDGVCMHFSSAEVAGSERTGEQKVRFEAAVAQMKAMGLKPRWVHAGSSSSVDVGEGAAWLEDLARSVGARAMVRSGIALYGYTLPAQGAESRIRAKLKPVMTWKTRVLDVREVAAGEPIGYNATFTAKGAMRVALLPVGYSNGLRRELSGSNDATNERTGGWVMVRGSDGAMRRAMIVGRVSMNLTTVDVTGIGGVRVGDEVVLLGDGTTADDHAQIAGTIAYEILCGIRA
jgi:alanine racemase